MTNDLNTIPASVRDAYNRAHDVLAIIGRCRDHVVPVIHRDEFKALTHAEYINTVTVVNTETVDTPSWVVAQKAAKELEQALPLIERLCQPNIVIVDLDDEKLVGRIRGAVLTAAGMPEDAMYITGRADVLSKAALAALKEKV